MDQLLQALPQNGELSSLRTLIFLRLSKPERYTGRRSKMQDRLPGEPRRRGNDIWTDKCDARST